MENTKQAPQRPSAAWLAYRRTMTKEIDLHEAARANDVAAIRRLLDGGADVNAKDGKGYAPLMLAAYAGHAEALEVLLAGGADADGRDAAGNTVVMGAAFKGHGALLERLAAAGADLRARNGAGMDARQFAQTFGRAEIVALLDRLGT